MKKQQLINRLLNLYNNNSLTEEDEITIQDTLIYLGFDIRML